MKKKITIALFALFTISILLLFSIEKDINQNNSDNTSIDNKKRTSGAGKAIDMWSFERSYPNYQLDVSKYLDAFNHKKQMDQNRSKVVEGEWENLGPKNIGGRTLCLAFHPIDENIMFAGSASGGLWKTTTQGVGEDAWESVPTGFPVLGVAAIAINPDDPDIMIIGTGETYGVGYAEPGTVNRLTRGTYGIGILRTEDGGTSWTQVLPFEMDEIKGIQDIEINALNPQEVYAAATDGLYQSLDGGVSWNLILDITNCIDVELDYTDGSVIYVSHGNFNLGLDPNLSGIYRSTNKGASFQKLEDSGLITAWSGNAKLEIDPTDHKTIYASIQVGWFNTGATTPAGIFKSTDAGETWTVINNQNIAQFQGWYSHDVAVNPESPNEIINVGVNGWLSVDTGNTFSQKSINSWTMGQVPVDIPEGADSYVHSDIHGVYYHPLNNKVFYATDGGVFVSENGDVPFTTLNGGLQTLQLYADMGSSGSDPNFLIAGAQDNASYIYKGSPSWWRVIGGDGMSASVNQNDDQIVYGSWQGLSMVKSLNNGFSFGVNVRPTLVSGDFTAFSAPYELAPSNQDLIYAGGTYLYKTADAGINWNATSGTAVDVMPIMNIAISYTNPDIVYVSTSPDPTNGPTGAKILRSFDGGQTFEILSNGLPDRICKDLEFDPSDDLVLYATFSGFGSNHVYKTTNGGDTWFAIDNGLPDVPTNTILIDELNPDDIYIGNDLGVYYSENGGDSWEPFNDALPEAIMVYDLNNSPSNRKIRIATHGRGIYQRNYVNDFLNIEDYSELDNYISIYPNPASNVVNIDFEEINNIDKVHLNVFTLLGQEIENKEYAVINNQLQLDVSSYNTGVYLIECNVLGKTVTKTIIIQ